MFVSWSNLLPLSTHRPHDIWVRYTYSLLFRCLCSRRGDSKAAMLQIKREEEKEAKAVPLMLPLIRKKHFHSLYLNFFTLTERKKKNLAEIVKFLMLGASVQVCMCQIKKCLKWGRWKHINGKYHNALFSLQEMFNGEILINIVYFACLSKHHSYFREQK